MNNPKAARLSFGGTVVDTSLQTIGFEVQDTDVALVETRRPRREPFRTVLAQSVWNVMPRSQFDKESKLYSPSTRFRMELRRQVSQINLRRADKVVCLTEAMAELCDAVTKSPIIVKPVLAPLDLAPGNYPHRTNPGTIVTPGTITWFKRPWISVRVAAQLRSELDAAPHVNLVGKDDGSGALQKTLLEARELGVEVDHGTVGRTKMFDLLNSCTLAVIPSALESLGFCITEALSLAPRVAASRIPAHREASYRLGRQPVWLEDLVFLPPLTPTAMPERVALENGWRKLGLALGLDSTHTLSPDTGGHPYGES